MLHAAVVVQELSGVSFRTLTTAIVQGAKPLGSNQLEAHTAYQSYPNTYVAN